MEDPSRTQYHSIKFVLDQNTHINGTRIHLKGQSVGMFSQSSHAYIVQLSCLIKTYTSMRKSNFRKSMRRYHVFKPHFNLSYFTRHGIIYLRFVQTLSALPSKDPETLKRHNYEIICKSRSKKRHPIGI